MSRESAPPINKVVRSAEDAELCWACKQHPAVEGNDWRDDLFAEGLCGYCLRHWEHFG